MILYDLPPETLGSFLEATAVHPHEDRTTVAEFAGFKAETARKALSTLATLGAVELDGSRRHSCAISGIRRGASSAHLRRCLRDQILSFRPFMLVAEGLAFGEPVATAIRKACVQLGLEGEAKSSIQVLVRLAVSHGLIEDYGGDMTLHREIAPKFELPPDTFTISDMESTAKARLYIAKVLGRVAFEALDEIDIKLMSEALVGHHADPGKAATDSGKALEDYLRDVASKHNLVAEASERSGASQLCDLLLSKSLVHKRHKHMVDAVGTTRNAKAHNKDQQTLKIWEMTPLGAFYSILGCLLAIRSVEAFRSGQQIV